MPSRVRSGGSVSTEHSSIEHQPEVLERGPADPATIGRREAREGPFDVRERHPAPAGQREEPEIPESTTQPRSQPSGQPRDDGREREER